MLSSLKKTQTKKIEKNTAEEIMKSILVDFKELNSKTKIYIKIEIVKFNNDLDKEKKLYINISNRLSSQLKNFIKQIALKLKDKQNLTDKEKNLVLHLKNLEGQTKKLDYLSNTDFKNKDEIRSNLVEIFKKIRIEVKKIKSLVR
jgi:hypothetical protein